MRKNTTAAKRFRSRYSKSHRFVAVLIMMGMSSFLFALPAMARNTYVITDGSDVIVHSTFSQDPDKVLYEAGLELDNSDTYTTQENGGNLEITVNRRQLIQVYVDGAPRIVSTFATTVGGVLKLLGITLGAEDRVSVPTERQTYDGMHLRVTRVSRKTITQQQVVPAGEKVFYNNVLTPGQETVLADGMDGLDEVTYSLLYEDGVELAKDETQRVSIKPAAERVVIRGATSATMPTQGEGNVLATSGGAELTYSKVIDGKATAYNCPGYVGHTASGTVAEVGKVAVDPKVIPLGTKLYVVSQDGQYVYGYCVAEDTGGLIKGNKVDLYFSTWDECIQFGYRPVTIYVVE